MVEASKCGLHPLSFGNREMIPSEWPHKSRFWKVYGQRLVEDSGDEFLSIEQSKEERF